MELAAAKRQRDSLQEEVDHVSDQLAQVCFSFSLFFFFFFVFFFGVRCLFLFIGPCPRARG